MFYKTTADTSFKGHFISCAKVALHLYRGEKHLFVKACYMLAFVIAPFFWAYTAWQRSKAKEGVRVLCCDPNPNWRNS